MTYFQNLLNVSFLDLIQKHRGITAFVVERDTPGLIIGKKEDKVRRLQTNKQMDNFRQMRWMDIDNTLYQTDGLKDIRLIG